VYWVNVASEAAVRAALALGRAAGAPPSVASLLQAVNTRDAESAVTTGTVIHRRRFRNMIPER
jgi:hypothetical protein